MHTPDSRVWDERGEPVFDEKRNLIGVVEIAQDITELKQAEEALRESEERYRDIFENSVIGLFQTAPGGRLINVNDALAHMYGFSSAAEMLTSDLDVGSPPYANSEERQEVLHILVEKGKIENYETQHLKRDGTSFWVSITSRAFLGPDGAVLLYEGTIIDISERKHAEDALRQSEQLFREVINNANDAIFLLERTPEGPGKYLLVNDKAIQILGYSEKELLEISPRDIVPKDIAKKIMPEVIKKLLKDGHANFESAHRRKDGSIYPIEVSTHTFRHKEKDVDLSIVRDITERKRAEDALRIANKKLTLLSSITRHDINNQLTVLMGYINILEKKQPDPSLNEYFGKVTTTAQRISAMIRFTKGYEEIGVIAPTWQECHKLVDTATKQIQLRQVVVENDLPSSVEVFADLLIGKIFYNLIDNAVRHGGKITTIRFSMKESGDSHLIICEDDGEGVSTEDKEDIFKHGFGKNSGLGLTLVKEILDITGITICETGEPGKGARFEITVPNGKWRHGS